MVVDARHERHMVVAEEVGDVSVQPAARDALPIGDRDTRDDKRRQEINWGPFSVSITAVLRLSSPPPVTTARITPNDSADKRRAGRLSPNRLGVRNGTECPGTGNGAPGRQPSSRG